MDAVNKENMQKYFDLINVMTQEIILRNYCNMGPRPPKIIAPKGPKKFDTGAQDKSIKLP